MKIKQFQPYFLLFLLQQSLNPSKDGGLSSSAEIRDWNS